MKNARLKTVGAAAAVLLTFAAYPGVSRPLGLATAFPKNAALSGRVVYVNGRPASGVQVIAQMQDQAQLDLTQKTPPASVNDLNRIYEMYAMTKPDGSYRLVVAPHLRYNILVNLAKPPAKDDRNAQWVAAAKEGVVGKADKTTTLSNLVLTKGVFVSGLVTDQTSGQPLGGVHVGSCGPARPASSAMIIDTVTDRAGLYRLRVIPGSNKVYIADGRYNGLSDEKAKAKGLMKTVVAATGQPVRADFQVSASVDAPKPGHVLAQAPGKTLTASELAARCREAYASLKSYQGATSVTTRSLTAAAGMNRVYYSSANIRFVRPGKIQAKGKDTDGDPFAYVSNNVTTSEDDVGDGIWHKAESAEMAIAGATGVAMDAATTIPALLLGTKWGIPFTPNFGAEVREDDIDGKPCYVITDFLASGTRALTGTLWIDEKTFLLRRYVYDSDTAATSLVAVGVKRGAPAVKLHSDQRFTNERLNETIPESTFKVLSAQ